MEALFSDGQYRDVLVQVVFASSSPRDLFGLMVNQYVYKTISTQSLFGKLVLRLASRLSQKEFDSKIFSVFKGAETWNECLHHWLCIARILKKHLGAVLRTYHKCSKIQAHYPNLNDLKYINVSFLLDHYTSHWSHNHYENRKCCICKEKLYLACIDCKYKFFCLGLPAPVIGCDVAYNKECGHSFHRHCVDRWLTHRNVCPLDNIVWEFKE